MRSIALLFAAALLCAQPPARVQTGYDSIQPARLKADLTFLSSDALEGRMSLQRGSEIAIQWIASEFAKAGLKPLVATPTCSPCRSSNSPPTARSPRSPWPAMATAKSFTHPTPRRRSPTRSPYPAAWSLPATASPPLN